MTVKQYPYNLYYEKTSESSYDEENGNWSKGSPEPEWIFLVKC